MQLVDTHCHIQSVGAGDGERSTRELWAKHPELTADGIVSNAAKADVTKLICVGCDVTDSQLAIDFVKNRENCFASIGIHPHEAGEAVAHARTFPMFTALAMQPKVVAIGECGLDYFYEHSPREDQIAVLRFQLALAVEADLPVIFHVRDALDDFWPIFDDFGGKIRGVLHSFTDTPANLDKAIERGLFIGVNGIATFAKQPQQIAMYKAIPKANLLLETDSPFLTPTPFRGTINEPKQIRTVAEFLAVLRNEDIQDLAEYTTQNAHGLFHI